MYIFVALVLTASVEQEAYQVREEDELLTVCVTLTGGTAARPVHVTVLTEPVTALGKI